MTLDDFKDPKIDIRQLQTRNSKPSSYPFEQMVLSRLADTAAKFINAYYVTTAGSAESPQNLLKASAEPAVVT
jgi:hypothetical protein